MSAFDTHPEHPAEDSATLQSRRAWKVAGQQDLDFESQQLRNRLRAKMFGVDASPVNIGRFTVLETVGSGGMGVVYAAYDRELDRRIAVKLLRAAPEEDASVGKGRLLREAQALAKLSHPNVVQVYEVGTFNDRVFLAMEFLAGPNLRAWLMDEPRTWQEVLRHFIDAGRGLAAAHQHGVIHRDFKPANLLFGAEGRVRVVDFGLARASEEVRLAVVESEPSQPQRPFAVELTQTGEIMGTPAYMSPEQARHEAIDARSDQYSFCVALYEALFGVRPHAGRSTTEVLLAVAEGDVRQPPRATKVPVRVVRAVMRGLALDPADRFATMDELLDELAPRDRGRWRWVGLGGVAVAGLGVFMLSRAAAPCPSFDDALDGAWGADQRAQVEAAFGASAVAGAGETSRLAGARLDAYAREWLDARRDVCEAHLVQREQSADLHDRRVACLVERRAELATLTHALATPDDGVIEQAPRAAAELSPVSQCGDLEWLQQRGGMDPTRQDLRVRLAQAQAQYKIGHFEQALEALTELAEAAHEHGAPELEAAALVLRGSIHQQRRENKVASEAYEQAADLAEAGADDERGAQAWIYLVRSQVMLGQLEQAEHSLRRAQAKTLRVGDERLDQQLRESQAGLAWNSGRFDEAIAVQSQVVDEIRQTFGDYHPRTADAERRLASILSDAGHHAEAQARYTSTLALMDRTLGAEHPDVTRLWFDIGLDHRKAGNLAKAVEAFERVERDYAASSAFGAAAQLDLHEALSDLARLRGEVGEAQRHADLALELANREGAPVTERLDALALQINLVSDGQDHAATERLCREFLEILESGSFGGYEYVRGAYTRFVLIDHLAALGRHAEVEVEAERLLADIAKQDDESLAPLRGFAVKALADARKAREALEAGTSAIQTE